MTTDEAVQVLLDGLKGFHGRFKKIYGQVALRIDEDTYLMTVGNHQLSAIIEDDLQVCDINSGDLGVIFNARPDINAFIFGCSQDTVTASDELDVLPIALEDMAQIAGDAVKITPDASPKALLNGLAKCDVCLVKGSGAISVGKTVKSAVAAMHILEKSCEAYNHGKMLEGVKPLSSERALALRENYIKNYVETNDAGTVNYIGFDEKSFQMRSDVIDYGKKLIDEDLAYGSGGNLSIKLSDEAMLINPSAMDYYDIAIEDVVEIDLDTLEYGEQRIPSSDAELHACMYRNLPGCGAIIHTHSNACSVFAACEAGFAIPDPNLRKLIGDIKVVPYTPDSKESTLSNLLSTLSTTHAVIMPHHGAIFYGPSMEMAFEIAKNVELIARNLLQFDVKNEDE